jgi:formate dehydrogenase subunit gamma
MDTPDIENIARAIAADYGNRPDGLIEILHRLQELVGYVPESAVQVLGDALNLSRAEVHGVVTFYHDFRHAPAGRHVLKLCRAEACQSMGADALIADMEERLKVTCGHGQTTADGAVTFEPAYCLGLCATAPSGMLDGRVVGRLNADRLQRLLASVAHGHANDGARTTPWNPGGVPAEGNAGA